MRAVFLPSFEPQSGQILEVGAEAAHHLIKVVRLKVGEELLVMNGQGWIAEGKVTELGKKDLNIEIVHSQFFEKRQLIKLVISVPSKEAMEDVLRQSVELGISHIQPIISRYSERNFEFTDRHQRIFESALIQSNNPYFPTVAKAQKFEDFLAEINGNENYLYFSSRPRENTQKSLRSPTSLIIGPEGGFSEEEEKALETRVNVKFIHLPSYILRTPTAVSAAAGLVFADYSR